MAKDPTKGDESIVNVQEVYSKTEQYVEDNKNTLLIVAGVMVLLFAGYFAVTRLYLDPRSNEGMDQLWKAEYWFQIDSLDRALAGDESHYGLEYIADEYSNTDAGALASYYAGIIYLKKGEYERAISYLEDADLDDAMAGAIALGSIGDAYVELGQYDQALDYYAEAVEHSDNNVTAPLYLKKAGLVYEDMQQYEQALEKYERIKEEFPRSSEARIIDGYIARVGG